MSFVLLTMGGAVLAFLGFIMEVLGKECGINLDAWRIILYACAVLMAVAGVVDGLMELISLIRRHIIRRNREIDLRATYLPPKNKAPVPRKPVKTPPRGKVRK